MHIERIAVDPIRDRDSWLMMRRQNINASEVAIVCGEGAFGSLAELYAEKRGMRPPLVDSGVLRRGRYSEAAVFEALGEETKWDLARAKVYFREPELRLGATPDGFALAPDRPGRGVIQAKTVARSIFRNRWLWDPDTPIESGDADAPGYYRLQVLTEMMLSEAKWGVLAVLVTSEFDSRLRLFDIEPDPTAEARILTNVARFWQDYFDPGIMPPFEPQRDEALIKALYPRDTGATIDLRGDNRATAVVEEWIEISAALKRLKKQEETLKTELKGKLSDHSYGLLAGGRRVSWRVQHRRGYPVKPSNPRVLKILPARQEENDE
jgi:predicted phage-related endonuclease